MSEAAAEAAMLAEALSQMSHDAADTINRRALSKGMDCPEGEDTAHGESSSPPLDEYASSDAPDAEHNDEEGVSQLEEDVRLLDGRLAAHRQVADQDCIELGIGGFAALPRSQHIGPMGFELCQTKALAAANSSSCSAINCSRKHSRCSESRKNAIAPGGVSRAVKKSGI